MRLQNFYKEPLNEKVSKKDIDTALKNRNIIIGAEYEFIADALENYTGHDSELQDMYDNAMADYENFNSKYEAYQEEYNSYYDKESELDEKIEELENEASEIESEIGDLEDEIEALSDELAQVDNMFATDEEGHYNFDEIDSLREQIADKKSELFDKQEELKRKQSEVKEAESDRDDIIEERDELETPYPDYDYRNYWDYLYDNYAMGNGAGAYEYYFEGTIDEPENPEYMDIGNSLDDEDTWKDVVEQEFTDALESAPFDEYEILGYHDKAQKVGDTYWKVEYDSSIASDGGIEVVTPPLELSEWLDIGKDMFDWIFKYGSTSSATGFHIHIGLKGVNDLRGIVDPIKLVLMFDEEFVFHHFKERAISTYCSKMKEPLAQRGISVVDIANFIDHKKLEKSMSDNHFQGLNFGSWDKGHIEFRYMGGSDYHRKWKTVKTTVARYIHALSIACDEEFMREEYATKLVRMANKLDYMKWKRVHSWYGSAEDQVKRWAIQNNKRAEYDTLIKWFRMEMRKIRIMLDNMGVKSVSEEIQGALSRNYNFMGKVEAFAKDRLTKDLIKLTGLKKGGTMDSDLIRTLSPYVDVREL